VQFWNGGSGALELGGVTVSGNRNYFSGCHFVGSAGVSSASARSVQNSGEENFFDSCTIGTDTITRAACADLLLVTPAARNRFRECEFIVNAGGTTTGFVHSNATEAGRPTVFDRCIFNAAYSGAVPADVHLITGTVRNLVMFHCSGFNITGWGASVWVDAAAAAASAAGAKATVE
jgi:hypothetical protein